MQIVCWNVNSIRARKERFLSWLKERQPDVVCLQETKVVDSEFPADEIASLGYNCAVHGQKTYNGVAIVSRLPLSNIQKGFGDHQDDNQSRIISAFINDLRIISVYVPNGGELGSDKYAYKLKWLKRLRAYLDQTANPEQEIIVAGDFNIAWRDCDAAHPEAWRDSVLAHTSIREAFAPILSWGLRDLLAEKEPNGGVFSWWDYRQLSFARNDGLRIDLLLTTETIANKCSKAWVDKEARKGEKPSDHAPVFIEFAR
ncbi:MAG: exodeoxyribonuclease III [Deltaproteobacteria bacterium]|nr:exodeoxyribonuclease III [Deltaproteobacteria bacterium]